MYLCIPIGRRLRRMSFMRACQLAVRPGSGGIVYALASGRFWYPPSGPARMAQARGAAVRAVGASLGPAGTVVDPREDDCFHIGGVLRIGNDRVDERAYRLLDRGSLQHAPEDGKNNENQRDDADDD